jgi:pSer/pThr/pTyr-binding forkhead associated (FHA) protein
MAILRLQRDGQFVSEQTLNKELMTIGRSDNCDLPVDNPGVSRIHCQIKFIKKTNTYLIHDNGSSNGTFVNGVQIPGFQELKNGDTVNLGKFAVVFDQHHPAPAIATATATATASKDDASLTITSDHPPIKNVSEPVEENEHETGTFTYNPHLISSQDETLIKQAFQWIAMGAAITFVIAGVLFFF